MWLDLLTEDKIHIATRSQPQGLDLTDKWTLIRSLYRALCQHEGLNPAVCGCIEEELFARERQMSTGIGEQMAIPHAVVAQTDRFLTRCAILPEGIDFDSIDSSPAYIVVLLIAPKALLHEHLKIMAEIARIFYPQKTREKVIAARNPGEALSILRQAAAQR
ncbi:MAG: PTS sugar transporter subunit IIA [Turneriella sp.]|nr:PTS sugar transporter subunit IIA [Leptospiraceae bacterium]MCX7632616.1 PTS sugar transporter subunit IIA [Turneriella sp.]